MKKFIACFVMLLAILFCYNIASVHAEQVSREYFYRSPDEGEVAKKEVPLEYVQDVDESGAMSIFIMLMKKSDIDIEVVNSAGDLDVKVKLLADEGQYFEELDSGENSYPYLYRYDFPLKKGSGYRFRLTFSEGNNFGVSISREGLIREMPVVTLTEGMSTTRKPSSYTAIKWNSSNPKVVTVKNGKFVGKKKGVATVTAYVKDSLAYVWNISVKENIYEEKPIELSKKNKKKKLIQVYRVSYKKKKLVLKVRILNNTSINYEKLQKMKVTVRTSNGKKIGSFSLKSKDIEIPKHSVKNLTFTIPKPNIKNADLRCAKVTTKGTLYYMK